MNKLVLLEPNVTPLSLRWTDDTVNHGLKRSINMLSINRVNKYDTKCANSANKVQILLSKCPLSHDQFLKMYKILINCKLQYLIFSVLQEKRSALRQSSEPYSEAAEWSLMPF